VSGKATDAYYFTHDTQKEEVYISTKGQEHSKVSPFEQKKQSAK
jgi:hypothetical protein